jgi:hypothetical protein
VAKNFDKKDYTDEELISVQSIKPRFLCPHCMGRSWADSTTFKTPPGARLWTASSVCNACEKKVRWLIDPDRTMELQTEKMHRPIGL